MTLVLRGMFTSLLVLGIAAQAARMSNCTTADDTSDDIGGKLARLGAQFVDTTPLGYVAVAFSKCADPVTVMEVGFDGSAPGSPDVPPAKDTARRYVYLGLVGNRPDFAGIAGRWAFASALQVFGMRRGTPSTKVVIILIPKSCPGLMDIDWSILSPWD